MKTSKVHFDLYNWGLHYRWKTLVPIVSKSTFKKLKAVTIFAFHSSRHFVEKNEIFY